MADFLAQEMYPQQTVALTPLKGGENGLSAFSIMLKVVREKDNFQLSSAPVSCGCGISVDVTLYFTSLKILLVGTLMLSSL